MSYVDPQRAGKRVCVWLDSNGNCNKISPAPPQKTHAELIQITSGGQLMHAGKAIKLGYLTYSELKSMYPLVQQTATEVTRSVKSKSRIKTKKETTRWGITNDDWPQWTPLKDQGKVRDDYRNYKLVETRTVTLQIAVDGDNENVLAILDFTTAPYERKV